MILKDDQRFGQRGENLISVIVVLTAYSVIFGAHIKTQKM